MRTSTIFATHAIDLAEAGWEVFPLRGKIPAIPTREGGRGVLDATTDHAAIASWVRRYPWANIGARVPERLMVIDTDPRRDGEDNLQALAASRAGLPETLTVFSGRGDGGRHRYYLHPGGQVSASRLPAGVDLKTHAGYCVVPPSLHPDTGKPYRWTNTELVPVPAPNWLVALLRPVQPLKAQPFKPRVVYDGDSIADWFTAATTWPQVLVGWTETRGGWRHPTATATISATVRHDRLFVYTTSTMLEATGGGDPHGYTRFRAWAVLQHGGDLRAAARAARALKDRAA